MVKPKNARNMNPTTLDRLFSRFPNLQKGVNSQKAVQEWRDHVHIDPVLFDCANEEAISLLDSEKYWATVFSVTKNGAPCYPNLNICIGFLFSMPFSNVAAERIFSVLKLVKTRCDFVKLSNFDIVHFDASALRRSRNSKCSFHSFAVICNWYSINTI